MRIKRTSNKIMQKRTPTYLSPMKNGQIYQKKSYYLEEYYLEEYEKVNSIKTRRNRYLGRNKALVCQRTAEEAKTALADINMYQGWTAEL